MEVISSGLFLMLALLVATILGFFISYIGAHWPLLGSAPCWLLIALIWATFLILKYIVGIPLDGFFAWFFIRLGEAIG